MLMIKNTPNNLGVEILGDAVDFQSLYDALHNIVGEEGQYPTYALSKLRILGLCYDLRHAIQGDREYEFVDNGINPDILKYKSFIAPDKNLYLKIKVLWPELLFIQMVLNDFIMLYAKGNSKEYFDVMTDKKNIWDETIAQIRLFQSQVYKCIAETLSETLSKRTLGYMIRRFNEFHGYIPHYIDLLNIKFINMDDEQRLKNISIMAKRISEKGKEYQDMRAEIQTTARENNCPVEHIRINMNYPEELDW